ncbi:MAG: hypothetical protein O3C49_08970, partial [Proteobacteria bacterium]|nr:hypothetical protein [Pseudomonadota bacterium]
VTLRPERNSPALPAAGLVHRTVTLKPEQIAFQSANGWDIAGASSFGFATVWINRAMAIEERLPFGPANTLASLDGLPALLGLS